jgi:FkbM family methyltransferase
MKKTETSHSSIFTCKSGYLKRKKMYRKSVSAAVRFFLRKWPITEGKKQAVAVFMDSIVPDVPMQLSIMKDGFYLHLNTSNIEHLHMFLYGQHDERYEVKIMKKLIKKEDVIWDIGSNIGFYTVLFSKLANKGKVVSFEPASRTYEILLKQISVNSADNIVPNNFALGDEQGSKEFYYEDAALAQGTASFFEMSGRQHEKVQVETIDTLNKTVLPDIIKLDVEGYEEQVLIGGAIFFKENSPVIMIELKHFDKDTRKRVEGIIREFGYSIYAIRKRGLEYCENTMASHSRNFILTKEGTEGFERLKNFIL